MSLKTISAEELALDTARILAEAQSHAVVVNVRGGQKLVLRKLLDDDLSDDLIVKHPDFRRSIRKARQNRRQGKGIPLAQLRRDLRIRHKKTRKKAG